MKIDLEDREVMGGKENYKEGKWNEDGIERGSVDGSGWGVEEEV